MKAKDIPKSAQKRDFHESFNLVYDLVLVLTGSYCPDKEEEYEYDILSAVITAGDQVQSLLPVMMSEIDVEKDLFQRFSDHPRPESESDLTGD